MGASPDHAAADRPWPPQLRVVGLTGGLGTGKSTVAALFAARGIPSIDADALARAVVEPGTAAHAAIARAWPEVLRPDGTVDRARLADLVFATPTARRRLEDITHPAIREAAARAARALADAGHRVALYEAALLVETGRHHECDGLIVVTAPEAEQVRRAVARGGLDEAQARARMAAQLPLARKLEQATYLIDNGGDLEATRMQVARIAAALASPSAP